MLSNTLIRLSKQLSKFIQGLPKSFYQLRSNSITFSISEIFRISSRECFSPSQRILRRQSKWPDCICMKPNVYMVISLLNLRLVYKLTFSDWLPREFRVIKFSMNREFRDINFSDYHNFRGIVIFGAS